MRERERERTDLSLRNFRMNKPGGAGRTLERGIYAAGQVSFSSGLGPSRTLLWVKLAPQMIPRVGSPAKPSAKAWLRSGARVKKPWYSRAHPRPRLGSSSPTR